MSIPDSLKRPDPIHNTNLTSGMISNLHPKCVEKMNSVEKKLKSFLSSDSSKLESYKQICSDLFESFDRDVRMDSYHDLVQSMIEWQG